MLILFHQNQSVHPSKLTRDEMLELHDVLLEGSHNFIQWLFPLPEPSKAQPSSPVATLADYAFLRTPEGQASLLRCLTRMVHFWRRTNDRWRFNNHNHLRITRAIRCLMLSDLPVEAQALFTEAQTWGVHNSNVVKFWQAALMSDLRTLEV